MGYGYVPMQLSQLDNFKKVIYIMVEIYADKQKYKIFIYSQFSYATVFW